MLSYVECYNCLLVISFFYRFRYQLINFMLKFLFKNHEIYNISKKMYYYNLNSNSNLPLEVRRNCTFSIGKIHLKTKSLQEENKH